MTARVLAFPHMPRTAQPAPTRSGKPAAVTTLADVRAFSKLIRSKAEAIRRADALARMRAGQFRGGDAA